MGQDYAFLTSPHHHLHLNDGSFNIPRPPPPTIVETARQACGILQSCFLIVSAKQRIIPPQSFGPSVERIITPPFIAHLFRFVSSQN
ncbi:hypothetical protein Ddc_07058 [Ditylenchus destructor]|nr:hypothetical protein Ddc_07058 [Ditylenchus destructor]